MSTRLPAVRRSIRRTNAVAVTVALVISSVGFSAIAANAVQDSPFLSSFEGGDVQPNSSKAYGDQVNVTGKIPPGSLLASVTGVTTSEENGPGETAAKLLDNNSTTKWLTHSDHGWVVYTFASPTVITDYALTSASDAANRDPKNFAIEASNDGDTWVTLDTQENQAFAARQIEKTYSITPTTAYSRYRLTVSANLDAGNLTQLADWDLRNSSTDPTPMLAMVGSGPTNGPNAKAGVGFTGTKSLRYGGKHNAAGPASASDVLFDDVNHPIKEGTQLSYLLFPDDKTDLAVPSSWVAIDLVLDDGTTLSAKADLVDANGFGVTALAHGQQKSLFANEWNSVQIDLSSLAGRSVDKILLSYDYPSGTAATVFSGWVDDVRIGAAAPAIDDSNYLNYVDTRRGTLSSSSLSRGTNIPATAWPNGFNFFTPMTNGGSQGTLYEYQRANNSANNPTLQAIGISHEPSIWMGDRNQLGIMPSLSTTPSGTLTDRALAFTHDNEVARPDLYSVKFNNDLVTEVTPTDHGGIYQFQFPGTTGSVMVDKVGGTASLSISDNGTLTGWVDGGNGSGISRMFVSGIFDTRPSAVGTASGNRANARYAAFTTTPNQVVQLRLATSFISLAQATKNMNLEVTGQSFSDVNKAAAAAWNDRLDVIDVQGATDNQKVSLYSSLYRMNLYPNSQFENTGTEENAHYKHASPVVAQVGSATDTTTNAQVIDGKIYVNNGFWDTYRTVWPLYTLLYPKMAGELVDGFVQQYREGGWVARWSSPGYSDIMTGTSSDVAFADAYINGAVPTDTALDAYDAALKNATVLSSSSAVGRKALDTSIFLGYTPDSQGESVSWALEGYINDDGIGKMAAKLALDPNTPDARRSELREEAKYFSDRAKNYVQMFDPATAFFRPKTAAGVVSGGTNFDPTAWWGPYTETNGWNFAFHAPFDISGLESLYGGQKGLTDKLNEFFATPETGGGGNIHEMVEARAVRMGQLGMSNQPSHHIPYLYAAAGDPSKTQAAVREIEQRLFVGSEIGQGYLGDEDNGEMSSWFIFSALGFYPLSLGSGEYTIGSPLFTKSTIHLESGHDLVINAANNSTKNKYIASAQLNGSALNVSTLSHDTIAAGGTVDFTMSATPTTWADTTNPAKAIPQPATDATKAGYGTLSVSDSSNITALTDDNSRSETVFNTETPAVTWSSTSGAIAVGAYTITSGASGAAPSAWRLDGSNDGKHWSTLDTRTGQSFTWATQTRPFEMQKTDQFSRYRLTIDATTTGAPATLAELELLASPGTLGDLSITKVPALTATVGTSFTGTLANVSGGTGIVASDFTATADFADGDGPQPVTLTKTQLGTWLATSPHTFPVSAEYDVTVAVSNGNDHVNVVVPISVSRNNSLTGAFDTVCISDAGTAGNCDSKGWAFDRTLLAQTGFVQGTTIAVPKTNLTFELPAISAGAPDSATGNGQVIYFNPGTDATQISVIGTGTQAKQQVTGTLMFDDKTTAALPIGFGDWVGSASNPIDDGIVVATSAGRLSGASSGDGQTAGIFSTAPFTLPTAKTLVSLTLPVQTGSAGSDGRIHVFALASNGTRTSATALVATGSTIAMQDAATEFTTTLATVEGGAPATAGAYTARINWGDGSAVGAAPVAAGSGGSPASIAGTHTYAAAGDYSVAVTADDGITSTSTTTTIHVVQTYKPSITVGASTTVPGVDVAVTGTGFAAGETVALNLATSPAVSVTTVASGSGTIATTVPISALTQDGTYPVVARGSISATDAQANVVVEAAVVPPSDPTVTLSASSVELGGIVRIYGDNLPDSVDVTFTLHSTPVTLGVATVNGSGVLLANVVIPASTTPGQHHIEVSGRGISITIPLTVTAIAPTDTGKAPAAHSSTWHGLAYTGGNSKAMDTSQQLAFELLAAGVLITLISMLIRRRYRKIR